MSEIQGHKLGKGGAGDGFRGDEMGKGLEVTCLQVHFLFLQLTNGRGLFCPTLKGLKVHVAWLWS